ncbi:MAG TPA: hypothetical protein PK370_02360 [Candidatus Woesebacteria bacterium]|nr:hypothetical protein [Candidatus Woesebacteria bacterium]HPJ16606.1 hypothetical protein [Candidatus Woesebacteria bacterium]
MEENKNGLNKLLVIIFLVLIGLGAGIGGFVLGKNQVKEKVITINKVAEEKEKWKLPNASGKIVPILEDGKLMIYDRQSKKLIDSGIKNLSSGGAMGYGEELPLLSPDGKYVAFINQNEGSKLYLLVAGSLEKIKLTDYAVSYLTDWSPDSQKILYYTDRPQTIVNRKESEGMGDFKPWEGKEVFEKESINGFRLFNLSSGDDISLYPLLGAEGFVDSNRIWTLADSTEKQNEQRMVVFNINTFEADYSLVANQIPFGGHQITFDSLGKKWAYMDNPTSGTEGSMLVKIADFPSREGTIIDTGKWAEVQMPKITLDGKYVSYLKRGEKIGDGRYEQLTVVWDTGLKKEVRTIKGFSKSWIDNQTLIVNRNDLGSNNQSFQGNKFFLVNVVTGEEEKIN